MDSDMLSSDEELSGFDVTDEVATVPGTTKTAEAHMTYLYAGNWKFSHIVFTINVSLCIIDEVDAEHSDVDSIVDLADDAAYIMSEDMNSEGHTES